MLKKSMVLLLLAAAPLFVEARHSNSSSCEKNHCKPQCKDGRDGRDGRDGVCCCDNGCDRDEKVQAAYFYLTPDLIDEAERSRIIVEDEAVEWFTDVFTIKSNGINVDPDDNTKINISKSGVYQIVYTLYADIEGENSADWYTMALNLNGSEIAGSRFTTTLPSTQNEPRDSAQNTGQVIVYIPGGSVIQLVNASEFFDIRLENDGGRNGVCASISFEKIAKSIP